MRTLTIFLVSVTILIFVSTSVSAGWLIYHKPAFRGKAIDAETKEAIKGAVVVAIYEKDPLISGPAGGSSSVIKVKEFVTNEKGEFYFPPYTTIIQPFTQEGYTDFIIYKPGYGNFPGLPVSPPPLINRENFFSRDFGIKREIHRRSNVISVAFGVVELPRLKTREERLKAIPATPTGFRSEKLPLLYEIINEERKRYGLDEVK